jgi:multidrug efflux pump
MKLADFCIERPVFATVMSIMLVLVGFMSYSRLTVREYPNIDVPVVTVETEYSGANAEIIETQVTKPLEDSISGIEGIDFVQSISRGEKSQINVAFNLGRDPETAANDVRDRVARVRNLLPDDVDEPIVQKVEADAQPIMWLAFSSDKHSSLEITDIASHFVKDRLQTIDGVASVRIFGGREYAMRIWIDPLRLASYKLTAQDVEKALRAQNVDIPAGLIESNKREFTILAETDLQTPEEFKQIVLADAGGYLVRIGDVATVELGPKQERSIARFKGNSAVALGLVKQSTANPLTVSEGVYALLPEIEKQLPEGMKVKVAYDSSIFIKASLEAVWGTVFEAIILVMLVIFLFLHNVRATIIPLVAIPVSIAGAFIFLYAFGFSINVLTLLAVVLAIGLVVDDAIVVLENIYRHIEEGLSPKEAAFKGSREIGFAVVAMTLTLAAVYLPILFISGRTGKLFAEFALSLTSAVIVSGFVALTLSPMMCSRFLRHQPIKTGWVARIESTLEKITQTYMIKLKMGLATPRKVFMAAGILFSLSLLAAFFLRDELAPVEDRGTVIGFAIAPEGATLNFMDKYAHQMETIYSKIPEVDRYFVVQGFPSITNTISFLVLKPWDERSRKQQEIVQRVSMPLFGLTGVLAFANNRPSLGASALSQDVNFVIQTSATYKELDETVNAIMAKLRDYPGIERPDTDLKLNKPEVRVTVNRDKAAQLGVAVEAIGRTLETMMGGRNVTRFKRGGDQYDVMLQMQKSDRDTPMNIDNLYVRSSKNEMIPLSNVVDIEEGVAPKELNHFNKMKAVTIKGNIAPGYSLGQVLTHIEGVTADVAKTPVQIDYAGQSREYKQSGQLLVLAFLLGLGFIYLVLAAQFESFVDPFIILLSVPLAIAGALLMLKLGDIISFFIMLMGMPFGADRFTLMNIKPIPLGTLNIYSKVGLITLIGLVSKHGILIVEFANQLQAQGKSRLDAVVESARLRLRPILMTTGAMVLAALPLMFASGAGAESRQQIGLVIVGGLSIGTLFTLFVVPVMYMLLGRKTHSA